MLHALVEPQAHKTDATEAAQADEEGGSLCALPEVMREVQRIDLPVPTMDDDELGRASAVLVHPPPAASLPRVLRQHPRFAFLAGCARGDATGQA